MSANRFDALRLLFALVVFAYHGVALSALDIGGPLEIWLGRFAELSIQGFFIVSGALVFGSLDRSATLADYAGKRARRLYPAYVVVILIPAFASLVVTSGEGLGGVLKYIGANLIFLNFLAPDLPGLFETNRFVEVNGALWTLKIEVMFYLVLPVLGWLIARSGRLWWLLLAVIYVAAEAWRLVLPLVLDHPLTPELARQLPGQMAFFASGMVIWKVWDMAKAKPGIFGLVGVGLLAVSFIHPLLEPLRAAGLAGVVSGLAFLPGPKLDAARFGDVSYGVYITHFPIIQTALACGLLGAVGILGAAIGVTVAVLLASLLLWHLVERPALRRDSHYRRIAASSPT